jgi:hypothetical protein
MACSPAPHVDIRGPAADDSPTVDHLALPCSAQGDLSTVPRAYASPRCCRSQGCLSGMGANELRLAAPKSPTHSCLNSSSETALQSLLCNCKHVYTQAPCQCKSCQYGLYPFRSLVTEMEEHQDVMMGQPANGHIHALSTRATPHLHNV